jgi:hypothetical protein
LRKLDVLSTLNKRCLKKLRVAGSPTREAEGALRTYASSLMHVLSHECKLKVEAEAKKGETKLKGGHEKA